MDMITQLRRRPLAEDIDLPDTVPPLLRRLYAQRGVKGAQELEYSLRGMLPPEQLRNIESAVTLLQCALAEKRCIVIVGDFDADGATSTALAVLALRSMGGANVKYLVPNRFKNGYGLSPEVVLQADKLGADIIVTVDNGISSHAGVEKAHELKIAVLVTDHHLPGEILPDADAIINPNQPSCEFPSKALAGVGVAFYLMMALFVRLRDSDWFIQQGLAKPKPTEWLDLVALGTVADVVPLDANNRILVEQGLMHIRSGNGRPGIRALLEVANCDARKLVASDLGFAIGPRLNAAGRLDDMTVGVELLLSNDITQARMLANDLDALNQDRREIEQGMQVEALRLCESLERTRTELPYGLAMYHPEWHQGVVGILASRIKERFHRPVIAFAPAGDGMLKGSGRSIAGLHLRDVLERLDTLYPGMMDKFGGHAMAAGLSLHEDRFEDFRQRFGELVGEWLDPSQLDGVVWSDGELALPELDLFSTVNLLRNAGPWGQEFPEPTFDGRFRIIKPRLLKKRHLKAMFEPIGATGQVPLLDGIAFNIDTTIWPDPSIKEVEMVYRLDINEYEGKRSVQLMIQHLWPRA
ncbi:single-stranded-DNA-specific exonuclease RecJ [Pectobacterium versatile]|uniref:single-stranded-DNA-specific exonuclease RecJ n=1 Tax=Pectobacterium versatile TaxID=2488639 RepID=UPI0038198F1C